MSYQQDQQSTSLFRTTRQGSIIAQLHDHPPHVPFIPREVAWDRDSRLQIDEASRQHVPRSKLHSEDAFPLWVEMHRREKEPFLFNELVLRKQSLGESSRWLKRQRFDNYAQSVNQRFTDQFHDIARFTERFREAPLVTISPPEERLRNERDRHLVKVAQAMQNFHPEIGKGLKDYVESGAYSPLGLEQKLVDVSARLLTEEMHMFNTPRETNLYTTYIQPFEREFGSIDNQSRTRSVPAIGQNLMVFLQSKPQISPSNALFCYLMLPAHDQTDATYMQVENQLRNISSQVRHLPDDEERNRLVNQKLDQIENTQSELKTQVLREIRERAVPVEEVLKPDQLSFRQQGIEQMKQAVAQINIEKIDRYGNQVDDSASSKIIQLMRQIPMYPDDPGYIEINDEAIWRPYADRVTEFMRSFVVPYGEAVPSLTEFVAGREPLTVDFSELEVDLIKIYHREMLDQSKSYDGRLTYNVLNHWLAMFTTSNDPPPFTVLLSEDDQVFADQMIEDTRRVEASVLNGTAIEKAVQGLNRPYAHMMAYFQRLAVSKHVEQQEGIIAAQEAAEEQPETFPDTVVGKVQQLLSIGDPERNMTGLNLAHVLSLVGIITKENMNEMITGKIQNALTAEKFQGVAEEEKRKQEEYTKFMDNTIQVMLQQDLIQSGQPITPNAFDGLNLSDVQKKIIQLWNSLQTPEEVSAEDEVKDDEFRVEEDLILDFSPNVQDQGMIAQLVMAGDRQYGITPKMMKTIIQHIVPGTFLTEPELPEDEFEKVNEYLLLIQGELAAKEIRRPFTSEKLKNTTLNAEQKHLVQLLK
jgi:hypothetical protein